MARGSMLQPFRLGPSWYELFCSFGPDHVFVVTEDLDGERLATVSGIYDRLEQGVHLREIVWHEHEMDEEEKAQIVAKLKELMR